MKAYGTLKIPDFRLKMEIPPIIQRPFGIPAWTKGPRGLKLPGQKVHRINGPYD
jgi:hypothetical protein